MILTMANERADGMCFFNDNFIFLKLKRHLLVAFKFAAAYNVEDIFFALC